MPAPRILLEHLSVAVRDKFAQQQGRASPTCEVAIEKKVAESTEPRKPRAKKKTLTPDRATTLVKSIAVSEDKNEVKIILRVSTSELSTSQQKGVFVGKDGRAHFFTKAKIAKAEKALEAALCPYAGITREWGRVPLEVTFDFYFPYASGTSKKNRHDIGSMMEKPDVDNLAKMPIDALTRSGFWEDDSAINTLLLRKRRTTGPTCIVIKITNLKPKFDALYRDSEEYAAPTLFSPTAQKPEETNPLADLMTSNS